MTRKSAAPTSFHTYKACQLSFRCSLATDILKNCTDAYFTSQRIHRLRIVRTQTSFANQSIDRQRLDIIYQNNQVKNNNCQGKSLSFCNFYNLVNLTPNQLSLLRAFLKFSFSAYELENNQLQLQFYFLFSSYQLLTVVFNLGFPMQLQRVWILE